MNGFLPQHTNNSRSLQPNPPMAQDTILGYREDTFGEFPQTIVLLKPWPASNSRIPRPTWKGTPCKIGARRLPLCRLVIFHRQREEQGDSHQMTGESAWDNLEFFFFFADRVLQELERTQWIERLACVLKLELLLRRLNISAK